MVRRISGGSFDFVDEDNLSNYGELTGADAKKIDEAYNRARKKKKLEKIKYKPIRSRVADDRMEQHYFESWNWGPLAVIVIGVIAVIAFMSYSSENEIDIVGSFVDILTDEKKESCNEAFEYINYLRVGNGVNEIAWNENARELAIDRAKDLVERKYFDHVTPEGECVKDFKEDYGFSSFDVLAENLWGYADSLLWTCTEAVDAWMGSTGHRANLLYPEHSNGAIGCYKGICVFLGVHNNPYGMGAGKCTTGEEGQAYWEGVEG